MALDFAAGCIGGAAGILTGYPFDTVKVRIQTGHAGASTSTFGCMSNIIKAEGTSSLYRGLASPMCGVAAMNAIGFGVYGNVLRRSEDPHAIKSVTIAGTTAGFFQAFIASPFELIKTQMQVSNSGRSTIETVKAILDQAGAKGLTRGISWTIAREVPGCAIYFGSYEVMIRGREDNFPFAFTAGGLAGIFSWIVTYPQDVIKSRLQADGYGSERRWKNGYHCLVESIRKEGYSFLGRGMGATIIRAFPVNGATLAVGTVVKRTLSDETYLSFFDSSCLYTSEHMNVKLPAAVHTVFGPNYQHLSNMVSLATDVPDIIQDYGANQTLTKARFHMESVLFSMGVPTENIVEKPILIGTVRNNFPADILLGRFNWAITSNHGLHNRIKEAVHPLFELEHSFCTHHCQDFSFDGDTCVMIKCLSRQENLIEPSILVRERGVHFRPNHIAAADFMEPVLDFEEKEARIFGYYYLMRS